MRFKTLAICALAALAVVACRKRGGGSEELDTKQIAIVTSIAGQQSASGHNASKVIADASTTLTGIQFLHVDGAAGQSQANTSFATATLSTGSRVAGDKQPIVFDGTAPVYDVDNNKTAYLMAYHPLGAQVHGVSNTWTATTINGATDILVSQFYSAGSYTARSNDEMKFGHALARLEIILEAQQGEVLADVQTAWGTITEVTVDNIQPNLVFDYVTSKTTPSGTAATAKLLKGKNYIVGASDASTDGVIGANANNDVKFASMLVPNGTRSITINVKNSKNGLASPPLKGTLTTDFEAGKIYQFRISFGVGSKDILISGSSIIDWVTGEVTSGLLPNPPAVP